ncbi:MAG: DUF1499 domain-containing protein [Acetobacterium sp.]
MNLIKVKERKRLVMIIIGIAAVFIIFVVGSVFLQNQKPQIELGLINGKLREVPHKNNAVSTETMQQDKLIKPLSLKKTLIESKEAMKKALDSDGGIEIKKEESNYIYAVATTEIMKFHDDIEIFFDEQNNKIQYRSASRAGYSDMGLNRERYNKIAQAYEKF